MSEESQKAEDEVTLEASFDEDLITKYPRANRKINVEVAEYSLAFEDKPKQKGHTHFISPYGVQFQGQRDYEQGTLLKIHLTLPDYWSRKQKFVEYQRVDTPNSFKVLVKVVRTEDVGKRGKKKMVVAQLVNIDEIDEKVLKSYLQDN